MAWAYVIWSSDRANFKRCRRAWGFGSRSRQNYELAQQARAFDFDQAMHDALALYYFPGMWGWNREIVVPMVLDGFVTPMEKQRTACHEARALSDDEEVAAIARSQAKRGLPPITRVNKPGRVANGHGER